jgi:hypothetical protein
MLLNVEGASGSTSSLTRVVDASNGAIVSAAARAAPTTASGGYSVLASTKL